MSDYVVPFGGSLKLKGGVVEGGIVKKYVYLIFADSIINPPQEEEIKAQVEVDRIRGRR